MAEVQKPHITFLTSLHADVLSAAGVPPPLFTNEPENISAMTYSPDIQLEFGRYYKMRETKQYLSACFDIYGRDFHSKLDSQRFKFAEASLIWVLASVAVAQVGFESTGVGARGSTLTDAERLSMRDRAATVAALVNLRKEGAVTYTLASGPDGEGARTRPYFRIAAPQGGDGRKVKERTEAMAKFSLPHFGISPA